MGYLHLCAINQIILQIHTLSMFKFNLNHLSFFFFFSLQYLVLVSCVEMAVTTNIRLSLTDFISLIFIAYNQRQKLSVNQLEAKKLAGGSRFIKLAIFISI